MKCENCGAAFVPSMGRQRFCCRTCSDAWFQRERREAVKAFRLRNAGGAASALGEALADHGGDDA